MGTISLTFRVPVIDKTGDHAGPFTNVRCADNISRLRGLYCGHRHAKKPAAEKCARSLAFGSDFAAVNERVEIVPFAATRQEPGMGGTASGGAGIGAGQADSGSTRTP
jgi:hypothetical protein